MPYLDDVILLATNIMQRPKNPSRSRAFKTGRSMNLPRNCSWFSILYGADNSSCQLMLPKGLVAPTRAEVIMLIILCIILFLHYTPKLMHYSQNRNLKLTIHSKILAKKLYLECFNEIVRIDYFISFGVLGECSIRVFLFY